jgi:hypothetical protein
MGDKMSSQYRLICMSHDPALIILDGEHREQFTPDREDDRMADHPECDVMIGQFSYPLVAVGCFGLTIQGSTECKSTHNQINWMDVDWLRLLYLASKGTVPVSIYQPLLLRCWTMDRLYRLAPLMGI